MLFCVCACASALTTRLDPLAQVNNYPPFAGEVLRVNSEPMSIGAQYIHPPDMASALSFNGPLSAPLSAGTKFNGNTLSVDERPRTSTSVAEDPEKSSSLVRVSAERWASRSGFTSDQMTEFGHLMGMVCSTYIAKNKLTSLKEIDSGSFGKIYSTTYDGVPGEYFSFLSLFAGLFCKRAAETFMHHAHCQLCLCFGFYLQWP
jgi:hypothetical protein